MTHLEKLNSKNKKKLIYNYIKIYNYYLIMSLILKFITKHVKPIDEMNIPFTGELSLRKLMLSFISLGLTTSEVTDIKFIMNNTQLKSLDEIYMVNPEDQVKVYLLAHDPNVKNKLIDIFDKYSQAKKQDELTQKGVKDEVIDVDKEYKPEPKMDKTIIYNQNKLTIKLFNDSDFRTLLKIYLTKPELFNILQQYTQSGNIVDDNKETKTIDQLSEQEIIEYNEQLQYLKSLNLNISDDIIIKNLIKYDGHLNLTLRSLLNDLLK